MAEQSKEPDHEAATKVAKGHLDGLNLASDSYDVLSRAYLVLRTEVEELSEATKVNNQYWLKWQSEKARASAADARCAELVGALESIRDEEAGGALFTGKASETMHRFYKRKSEWMKEIARAAIDAALKPRSPT